MKFFQSIRTDCIAILFSTMTCALMSGCASTKMGDPNQLSASYEAAMAGKSDEARNLLKLESGDPFSNFLLACIELTDGNLALSRRYADGFVAANPSVPDGKVLVELIEQRKAYPAEPWLASFAAAWKAGGAPELKAVLNFIERVSSSEQNETCNKWKIPEAFVGKPEELIAALVSNMGCNTEKFTEVCLSQTSPETPIAIKLLALGFLNSELSQSSCKDSKISDDLRERIQTRRREVIEELSHQLKQDMEFPINAIIDQGSKKEEISAMDIEQIEEAVSRPRLSPSPEELYNDYLARFIAVGSQNPYLWASSMAFASDNPFPLFDLKKKVMVTAETASPEVRRRLAEILEKVGRAQVKHKSVLSVMSGINTLRSAAQLKNDKMTEERLDALHHYIRKLYNMRILYATSSSRLWPIRPLMINATEMQVKNEIGVHQQFADVDMPDDFLSLLKIP